MRAEQEARRSEPAVVVAAATSPQNPSSGVSLVSLSTLSSSVLDNPRFVTLLPPSQNTLNDHTDLFAGDTSRHRLCSTWWGGGAAATTVARSTTMGASIQRALWSVGGWRGGADGGGVQQHHSSVFAHYLVLSGTSRRDSFLRFHEPYVEQKFLAQYMAGWSTRIVLSVALGLIMSGALLSSKNYSPGVLAVYLITIFLWLSSAGVYLHCKWNAQSLSLGGTMDDGEQRQAPSSPHIAGTGTHRAPQEPRRWLRPSSGGSYAPFSSPNASTGTSTSIQLAVRTELVSICFLYFGIFLYTANISFAKESCDFNNFQISYEQCYKLYNFDANTMMMTIAAAAFAPIRFLFHVLFVASILISFTAANLLGRDQSFVKDRFVSSLVIFTGQQVACAVWLFWREREARDAFAIECVLELQNRERAEVRRMAETAAARAVVQPLIQSMVGAGVLSRRFPDAVVCQLGLKNMPRWAADKGPLEIVQLISSWHRVVEATFNGVLLDTSSSGNVPCGSTASGVGSTLTSATWVGDTGRLVVIPQTASNLGERSVTTRERHAEKNQRHRSRDSAIHAFAETVFAICSCASEIAQESAFDKGEGAIAGVWGGRRQERVGSPAEFRPNPPLHTTQTVVTEGRRQHHSGEVNESSAAGPFRSVSTTEMMTSSATSAVVAVAAVSLGEIIVSLLPSACATVVCGPASVECQAMMCALLVTTSGGREGGVSPTCTIDGDKTLASPMMAQGSPPGSTRLKCSPRVISILEEFEKKKQTSIQQSVYDRRNSLVGESSEGSSSNLVIVDDRDGLNDVRRLASEQKQEEGSPLDGQRQLLVGEGGFRSSPFRSTNNNPFKAHPQDESSTGRTNVSARRLSSALRRQTSSSSVEPLKVQHVPPPVVPVSVQPPEEVTPRFGLTRNPAVARDSTGTATPHRSADIFALTRRMVAFEFHNSEVEAAYILHRSTNYEPSMVMMQAIEMLGLTACLLFICGVYDVWTWELRSSLPYVCSSGCVGVVLLLSAWLVAEHSPVERRSSFIGWFEFQYWLYALSCIFMSIMPPQDQSILSGSIVPWVYVAATVCQQRPQWYPPMVMWALEATYSLLVVAFAVLPTRSLTSARIYIQTVIGIAILIFSLILRVLMNVVDRERFAARLNLEQTHKILEVESEHLLQLLRAMAPTKAAARRMLKRGRARGAATEAALLGPRKVIDEFGEPLPSATPIRSAMTTNVEDVVYAVICAKTASLPADGSSAAVGAAVVWGSIPHELLAKLHATVFATAASHQALIVKSVGDTFILGLDEGRLKNLGKRDRTETVRRMVACLMDVDRVFREDFVAVNKEDETTIGSGNSGRTTPMGGTVAHRHQRRTEALPVALNVLSGPMSYSSSSSMLAAIKSSSTTDKYVVGDIGPSAQGRIASTTHHLCAWIGLTPLVGAVLGPSTTPSFEWCSAEITSAVTFLSSCGGFDAIFQSDTTTAMLHSPRCAIVLSTRATYHVGAEIGSLLDAETQRAWMHDSAPSGCDTHSRGVKTSLGVLKLSDRCTWRSEGAGKLCGHPLANSYPPSAHA